MIPVPFPESNLIIGHGQDDYEPLPVYAFPGPEGRITFCVRLSPTELEEISRTGTLWIQQLTFHMPFQPISLSLQKPELSSEP